MTDAELSWVVVRENAHGRAIAHIGDVAPLCDKKKQLKSFDWVFARVRYISPTINQFSTHRANQIMEYSQPAEEAAMTREQFETR